MFQIQSTRIRLATLLFFCTVAILFTDFLDSIIITGSSDDWRDLVTALPLIFFFVVFGAMTKTILQVVWQSFVVATIMMLFFVVKNYFNPTFDEDFVLVTPNFLIIRFLYPFALIMLTSAGLLVFSVVAWLIKIVFSAIVTKGTKQSESANNTF